MFGLFKPKEIDFGSLIKNKTKVIILLGSDFYEALDFLVYLKSWHNSFGEITVISNINFKDFWASCVSIKNVKFMNFIPNDEKDAIVIDFTQEKKKLSSFKNSLILSKKENLCNFKFSPWENPLPTFTLLFSLTIEKEDILKNLPTTSDKKEHFLIDMPFNSKIKKLKETFDVAATEGDPDLKNATFLDIYKLADSSKKIICFSENRKIFWRKLGLNPVFVPKGQDYAQLLER